MGTVDLQQALAAQDRLERVLQGQGAVRGIGVTRADGGFLLKVNLLDDTARDIVPAEIDGVTVRVQVTGRVRKRRVA